MSLRRFTAAASVSAFSLMAAACHGGSGVFVVAPFNDETRLAKVTATWAAEENASAGDAGLRFEVRVENLLQDQLYVRLERFSLTDVRGDVLASSAEREACNLAAREQAAVLRGRLALSVKDAARVAGFTVERFGVPLSERGRGIYREFLLQSGKHQGADVDQEIGRYIQAQPCS